MTDDELIDFVKDGFGGLSHDEYARVIALARIGAAVKRELGTRHAGPSHGLLSVVADEIGRFTENTTSWQGAAFVISAIRQKVNPQSKPTDYPQDASP